jgi:hypothetical protein
MSMSSIETAKALLRGQLQGDLHEKLTELRAEHPALDTAGLMALLPSDLLEYSRKVESGEAWLPPKPPPIYRFDPNKKVSPIPSLRTVLNTVKVHGVGGDNARENAVLVYGASHDEKLADEATKLMDKHPGALHRQLAEQLALDADPKLAQQHEADDELAANQQRIKDFIKDWINAAPPGKVRTFRDGWSLAQQKHPEWFEVLTP